MEVVNRNSKVGGCNKKIKNKRNELKVVKMLHGAKGNCRGFCGFMTMSITFPTQLLDSLLI